MKKLARLVLPMALGLILGAGLTQYGSVAAAVDAAGTACSETVVGEGSTFIRPDHDQ